MTFISITCFSKSRYVFCALLLMAVSGWSQEGVASPDEVKSAFEANYRAALEAIGKEDWSGAEVLLDSALKKLGDQPHENKAKAQAILLKAQRTNARRREMETTLQAAQEMLRQKRWADAITMFNKAGELGADQAVVKKGLAEAEAGRGVNEYSNHLADGMAALGLENWRDAEAAFLKALAAKPEDPVATKGLTEAREKLAASGKTTPDSTTGAATPALAPPPSKVGEPEPTGLVVQQPLALPVPETLNREQWERGAGSTCYWAGDLLHLEEGDEKFRLPLTGDFAVQIAVEARMDHRSMIYLDLRPDKKKQAPVVRGYGSKEGSEPFLEVGKDVAGRGHAQPSQQRIVLGVRRTGQQIEFFCDGQKIGETFAVPADAVLWLWVCGKGYMYAGQVIRR